MFTPNNLMEKVQYIVEQANQLVHKRTGLSHAPVNYACVFSGEGDFEFWLKAAELLGTVVKETEMGPVFELTEPIQTVAGNLKILKIRKFDQTLPEQGDADFTVPDYQAFKKKLQHREHFHVIPREKMEMIELTDKSFDVRAYFSHPSLAETLGLALDGG